MLEGYDLVYFGPEKWEGLWRNRHQLMSRFAQRNRVLYVEPKFYLNQVRRQWREGCLHWRDLWQDVQRNRVAKAGDNLYIYRSPLFVPVSGRYPLDRASWALWRGLLKSTMRKLGFDEPIVWLSRPNMVDLVGALSERLLIYHIVDEYLSYCKDDTEARVRQRAQERQMLGKADLVIVVSESLLQAKRPFNSRTYLVPNGVDCQAYTRALESDEPPPSDIFQLPRPLLGYSGLIADRLDLDLLRYVATTHPEWSLVLVGAVDDRRCGAQLSALRQMANVHFLGQKEIDRVPYYIKGFDVCLIPYAVNERAQNASPLKLYDYMAAGKPTVTTDFPAARQFREVVRIASSCEEFAQYIAQALSEEGDRLSLRRRRIAAQHTWENRVDQLSELIRACLAQADRSFDI